jgi:hypothetical protein
MMTGLLEWLRLNWLLLTVVVGLVLAFVLLRTPPTPGFNSTQDLDSVLTAGRPVVLEFYSNF